MSYTQLFADLVKHVETIAIIGGYPFLFLSVLLEGVPLVGTLVPGHVAIIVAGFLVRIGVLNLWITIIISVAAAFTGDYFGYFLGRKYGLHLIDRLKPFFFITDLHIAKAQTLLSKHTGKAMIIGRLSPMTRALMPFLVGTNNTPEKKFWIFNIIGGSIWALSSIFLGYFFGAGYQAVAGYTGKFILVAVGVALVILWGYRFVNKRFHVFKRYELFMLILNLISLWVLAKMIQDAWTLNSPLQYFDVHIVNVFMATYITPIMATVATWVSFFGDVFAMSVLGVGTTIILSIRRRWRSAIIMLLSLGSTFFTVGILKEFFLRERPLNALQVLTDPSFPSAHAAFAAAFFLIVAYLAMPKIKSWVLRELTFVVCVLITIAIGLSRLVLNVHWASDVIAGWSLGIFCATSSVLLVRYIGGLFKRKVLE